MIQKFIKDFIFAIIVMIIFVEIVVKIIIWNFQNINALKHLMTIIIKKKIARIILIQM
jgi:hypothetical protein